MTKLFNFGGRSLPKDAPSQRASWLLAQRNFFLVPRQPAFEEIPRFAGLFGVLVSPYR